MSAKRWPSVLTAFAVLFAGLTNAHAHVHLCLDGQEPPASVHLVHGSNHLHDHFAQTGDHDDFNLDVPNHALAKTFTYDLPAIVPLAGWALSLCSPTTAAPVAESDLDPHPTPLFWRPPLRAPPR